MVKARKNNNVILGLSEESVKRLKDGKPIRFNMKELGFDDIWINIFTGKTDESMALTLKKLNTRFCGCTSGVDCNAECVVPKWIAERVLKARDAHIRGDFDEVWHQLYSIADPEFTSLEPWETLEQILKD